MYRCPLLLVFPICVECSLADASSIAIPAANDNTIFSESLNSGGQVITFLAGRTNAAGLRRALVRFDVASHLPAASTVTGVTLTLNLDGVAQNETQARDVALHRLLAGWGEGTSGGGGAGSGQGQAPTTGDATWVHRFFDNQVWTTSGGDFVTSESSVASVGVSPGFYSWPSTATLVADVQGWLDDPATNIGWMLIGDESRNGTVRRFHSREALDEGLRPMLTIEYQPVPEPASSALLVSGLLLLLWLSKRRGF
jgi:hypothetical protein